jgi:predicted metal-dependent hydrolase
MPQLEFMFQSKENVLRQHLENASGKAVSLVITDNSTSILSFKGDRKSVALRLHRMFLSADYAVLDELAEFMKNKKEKTPLIRKFISNNTHTIKRKPPNKITIQTQGKYYDLQKMYDLINEEYFAGKVTAEITWGATKPRRAAARRTLGSYSSLSNTIRINPILDSKRVPKYFLELVVYHEMLHEDIGIDNGAKRRSLHSKEFKRREKLFKHYDRAIEWERKRL